jgi:methane/ammonia monooxygenase subunit B
MRKNIPARGAFFLCCLIGLAFGDGATRGAEAHGERNQEPFLRMRTLQWYDVKWSTDKINVNGEVVVAGKFRVFEDWPQNLALPDAVFLSSGGPGSVFVKKESYIDEVPAIQSTSLTRGRDYAFKLVLIGRYPGYYHLHPTLMVHTAGPLIGPGQWVQIEGTNADFIYPVKTLTGVEIPNLATWGVSNVVTWYAIWIGIALFWLLWWLRKPLLLPRAAALAAGREDVLITRSDTIVAGIVFVGTIVLVIYGFRSAEAKYPVTIPLQAGKTVTPPLPEEAEKIKVDTLKATYDVPGRSMGMRLRIENGSSAPVRIGEFTSASVRFINAAVPEAGEAVKGYPKDLHNNGLHVSNDAPINPGEVREVQVDATDAAWTVERLDSLLNDPDNRFGGLLFFYDQSGKRYISNVDGSIVPKFIKNTSATKS